MTLQVSSKKKKKKKKKTLVSLKNKSCSLDLEQKELLVMTNRALIFLPQIIGLLALFNVEMQPKTKKAYYNNKINNK